VIDIEVLNARTVESWLESEARDLLRAHVMGMEAGARVLESSARREAPRGKTGQLVSGIGVETTTSLDGAEAFVGSFHGPTYAGIVAGGVSHSWEESAHPGGALATPYGPRARIHHGPIRPNDWMDRALLRSGEAVMAAWGRAF
jgi:hypothetical protein